MVDDLLDLLLVLLLYARLPLDVMNDERRGVLEYRLVLVLEDQMRLVVLHERLLL